MSRERKKLLREMRHQRNLPYILAKAAAKDAPAATSAVAPKETESDYSREHMIRDTEELKKFREYNAAILARIGQIIEDEAKVPQISDDHRRKAYNDGLKKLFDASHETPSVTPVISGVPFTRFMSGADIVFKSAYGTKSVCLDPDRTSSTPEGTFMMVDPRYPDHAILTSYDSDRLEAFGLILAHENANNDPTHEVAPVILVNGHFERTKDGLTQGILLIRDYADLNLDKIAQTRFGTDPVYGAMIRNMITVSNAIKNGTAKDLPEILEHAGTKASVAPERGTREIDEPVSSRLPIDKREKADLASQLGIRLTP